MEIWIAAAAYFATGMLVFGVILGMMCGGKIEDQGEGILLFMALFWPVTLLVWAGVLIGGLLK